MRGKKMVDNVTVSRVCIQSPSFVPDLDGEKINLNYSLTI